MTACFLFLPAAAFAQTRPALEARVDAGGRVWAPRPSALVQRFVSMAAVTALRALAGYRLKRGPAFLTGSGDAPIGSPVTRTRDIEGPDITRHGEPGYLLEAR